MCSLLDFHTGLKCAADAGRVLLFGCTSLHSALISSKRSSMASRSLSRCPSTVLQPMGYPKSPAAPWGKRPMPVHSLTSSDFVRCEMRCMRVFPVFVSTGLTTTITVAWRRVGPSKNRFLFESSQGHSWWLFQPGSLTPKVVRLDPKQMEGGELWMMRSSVVAWPPEPT